MTTSLTPVETRITTTYDFGIGFKLVVDHTRWDTNSTGTYVYTLINSSGDTMPLGSQTTLQAIVGKLEQFT